MSRLQLHLHVTHSPHVRWWRRRTQHRITCSPDAPPGLTTVRAAHCRAFCEVWLGSTAMHTLRGCGGGGRGGGGKSHEIAGGIALGAGGGTVAAGRNSLDPGCCVITRHRQTDRKGVTARQDAERDAPCCGEHNPSLPALLC